MKYLLLFYFFVLAACLDAQDFRRFTLSQIDSVLWSTYNSGNFEAAAAQAQAAAPIILQKTGAKRNSFYVNLMWIRAECAYDLANYAEAQSLWDSVLLLEAPKNGQRYANFLHGHALSTLKMGKYAQAEIELQKVLDLQEKISGKNTALYAHECNDLAVLYGLMGEYEKANEIYAQTLRVYANLYGKQHADYAQVLHNWGVLALNTGDYERAERLLSEAMRTRLQLFGKNSRPYAGSLNNFAALFERQNRFSEAEALYKECLQLREHLYGTEHPTYINALNNLGILYKEMRRYDDGEKALTQAAKGYKNKLGEQHQDYITALNNLAILYTSATRYKEAAAIFKKLYQLARQLYGATHPKYATIITNFADLYGKMQQYPAAIALAEEALKISEQTQSLQHPHHQDALLRLARFQYASGETAKGRAYIQRFFGCLYAQTLSFPIQADWQELSKIRWESYQPIELLLQALEIVFEHEADALQRVLLSKIAIELLQQGRAYFYTEADRLNAFRLSSQWLGRSLPIFWQSKAAEPAFELAQIHKSALVLQSIRSSGTRRFGELPDSLARKEDRLYAEQNRLKARLSDQRRQQELDSFLQLYNALGMEISALQQRIRREYPRYAELRERPAAASAAALRALLPPNTALIEYTLSDSGAYAFYLDAVNFEMFRLSESSATLNAVADSLHSTLSDFTALLHAPDSAYRRYSELSHWCYARLLEPLLKARPSIERLIIIPDASIARLPFEVFLTQAPQSGEQPNYKDLPYLLLKYTISYSPSSLLWKSNIEQGRQGAHKGRILAMAADYSPVAAAPDSSHRLHIQRHIRSRLQPLPAARREVETLKNMFSEGIFLLNSSATEANFKRYVQECDIIHLAMHGLSDEQEPILSTLVMSESTDSTEDNFLYAHEISQMRLHAQLVVLSACETGNGKFENGNGVASLARAFAYAGVPSMLVSLWTVNDQTTAQLINIYYEKMCAGADKDSALRSAKLQYLQQAKGIAAHPAFWSAFLQVGDTRPLHLPRNWRWGWALAALGIGGALWVAKKKRGVH